MGKAQFNQEFGTISKFKERMDGRVKIFMSPGVNSKTYMEFEGSDGKTYHERVKIVEEQFVQLGNTVTAENAEDYVGTAMKFATLERTIKPISKESLSFLNKTGTFMREKIIDKLPVIGPRSNVKARMADYKNAIEKFEKLIPTSSSSKSKESTSSETSKPKTQESSTSSESRRRKGQDFGGRRTSMTGSSTSESTSRSTSSSSRSSESEEEPTESQAIVRARARQRPTEKKTPTPKFIFKDSDDVKDFFMGKSSQTDKILKQAMSPLKKTPIVIKKTTAKRKTPETVKRKTPELEFTSPITKKFTQPMKFSPEETTRRLETVKEYLNDCFVGFEERDLNLLPKGFERDLFLLKRGETSLGILKDKLSGVTSLSDDRIRWPKNEMDKRQLLQTIFNYPNFNEKTIVWNRRGINEVEINFQESHLVKK